LDSILTLEQAILRFGRGKRNGRRVVFTNGCFDLLHPGHVRSLEHARSLGDALIVGLNSDASVKQLKGEGRPVIPEHERAEILAALECVDGVVIFDDLTPQRVIAALRPDCGSRRSGSCGRPRRVRACCARVLHHRNTEENPRRRSSEPRKILTFLE
jgi:D-beta-D-heptose 7-phosphate kinase/D-beta-D-heptose 1-phosphate adenosyltransferase